MSEYVVVFFRGQLGPVLYNFLGLVADRNGLTVRATLSKCAQFKIQEVDVLDNTPG